MSLARQNFHEECEAGINKQINLELYCSYVYMSMAMHFDRDDVALSGFHKFFEKASDEERDHAGNLMKYQNKRGGRIMLHDIKQPETKEWGTGLQAMQSALDLQKHVNQALLDLHQICNKHGDEQMADYLECDFLNVKVDSIKQIAGYITQLKMVGPGLGEYLFDKETLGD